MASLHQRIMDAVVAVIGELDLPADADERVHRMKLEDEASLQFPCVLVTLDGCTPSYAPVTTEQDEKTYPVAVIALDRRDRRDQGDLPDWLQSLETQAGALFFQLLAEVPEMWHSEVRSMPAIEARKAAGPGYQQQAGGFWLDCKCITPRAGRV